MSGFYAQIQCDEDAVGFRIRADDWKGAKRSAMRYARRAFPWLYDRHPLVAIERGIGSDGPRDLIALRPIDGTWFQVSVLEDSRLHGDASSPTPLGSAFGRCTEHHHQWDHVRCVLVNGHPNPCLGKAAGWYRWAPPRTASRKIGPGTAEHLRRRFGPLGELRPDFGYRISA